MPDDLNVVVQELITKAPTAWLVSSCDVLCSVPSTSTREYVLQRLPATANADASFLMAAAVRSASERMSWEALSWTLKATLASYCRWREKQQIDLLWAGPSPADQIPARRIDQALYDLISSAEREVELITFAAAKIDRLADVLWNAAQRGVRIRLVLEFEESSEGQLSFDAIKAFPAALIHAVEVYHWPVEKRARNQAGRPGKLHAKLAIVDDCALISSANLTDDAFNRNLEVGALIRNDKFVRTVKSFLTSLIKMDTLVKLSDARGRS